MYRNESDEVRVRFFFRLVFVASCIGTNSKTVVCVFILDQDESAEFRAIAGRLDSLKTDIKTWEIEHGGHKKSVCAFITLERAV